MPGGRTGKPHHASNPDQATGRGETEKDCGWHVFSIKLEILTDIEWFECHKKLCWTCASIPAPTVTSNRFTSLPGRCATGHKVSLSGLKQEAYAANICKDG
jgi:hypothetical protein